MTNDDFHARRTELANNMAAAGAELLDFMGAAGALAAIPNTPGYVVAGELAAIRAQLDTVDPQRRQRKGERPEQPLYFGPEVGQPRRWAALITSAGHGVLQEYGSKFEHALPGQEVINVVEMVPGIANKAAEEGELPVVKPWTERMGVKIDDMVFPHEAWPYVKAEILELREFIAVDRATRPTGECRDDGRCQYAIDHGAEGLGHCPTGKCCMLRSAAPSALIGASVDTRAFRELLASAMDAAELATRTGEPHRDYKPARQKLIAHIDQHVASQVLAALNMAIAELKAKRDWLGVDAVRALQSQGAVGNGGGNG